MDNNITITLTGAQAYDFIRNQSLDEASINMLQEENSRLTHALESLQIKYDELVSNTNQYDLAKSTSIRLQHDTDLMQDSQYEKKSPFKRPIKPEPITLDEEWRQFVDIGAAPDLTNTKWSAKDSAVIENAVSQVDPTYYSVRVLARFLGRTQSAIRSRAIKTYKAHIRKGMIVREV